jgi:hypothetical protein
MKNAVFWDVAQRESCKNKDVLDERISSIFRAEKSASEVIH